MAPVQGRFFNVLVLMPAGALAIALLVVKREVAGHTSLDSWLGIGLLLASLELGNVTGLPRRVFPRRRNALRRRQAARRLEQIDKELAAIGTERDRLVKADSGLAARLQRLVSVPGEPLSPC